MDVWNVLETKVYDGNITMYSLFEVTELLDLKYTELEKFVTEKKVFKAGHDYEMGIVMKRKYGVNAETVYIDGNVILTIIYWRDAESNHGRSKYQWRSSAIHSIRRKILDFLFSGNQVPPLSSTLEYRNTNLPLHSTSKQCEVDSDMIIVTDSRINSGTNSANILEKSELVYNHMPSINQFYHTTLRFKIKKCNYDNDMCFFWESYFYISFICFY